MIKKKIISTILALCIALSVITVSGISASAVTANSLTVPAYTSRGSFVADFNSGKTVDTFVGSEKVYKFTLSSASNVMFTVGATASYGTTSAYAELCTDVNLTNKISMSKNKTNSSAYYTYLAKGTYYLRVYTYNSSNTVYLYAGQVKGSEIGTTLTYVKTNTDKTATLKFSIVDKPSALYVYTCNYGETDYRPTGSEVSFDSKNQFKVSYGSYQNSHTNITVVDTYGYASNAYANVLNKYTATLNGTTTKAYTGKAVKLSGITLKAGYDAVAYTATYKNNKKIGKASVTFKGKNGCIGSYSTTFKIVPGDVKKLKGTCNSAGTKVKLSWTKSNGATKYIVQTRKSSTSSWKTVATTKSKSYTLKAKKGYTYISVVGLKTVGKTKYKSANPRTAYIYKGYSLNFYGD